MALIQRANNKNILAGANAPNVILNAISSNKGGMGFLLGNAPYTVTALQAADIAAYIANPAAGTPNPAATLSTATLSFGNQVVQTTSGTMSATLTNSGSANLVLSTITLGGTNPTEFTRTGTCAPAASLAPKASCSVDVTFKPTATGARSATITIGHNASPNTSVLGLTGMGAAAPVPAVGLSATTLAFGNQMLGTTSAAKSVSISNTGTANLVLGTIVTTGTNASEFAPSKCSGSTLTPGASCAVDVTFTPAALNARSATLSIPSNASGSPHGVALSGNGVAAPAPAVTLSPASLAFGNQTVGASIAKPITLTNSGSAALGITSIAVSGSGFTSAHNCATTLAAAASCTISVTFTPTAAVASTGAVTITSAATGSPHTVGLSGTGTAPTPMVPVATLAPVAVDFGAVTLNTPRANARGQSVQHRQRPVESERGEPGGRQCQRVLADSQLPRGRCPGRRGELHDQRQVHARGDWHPCGDLDADVECNRFARGRPEGGWHGPGLGPGADRTDPGELRQRACRQNERRTQDPHPQHRHLAASHQFRQCHRRLRVRERLQRGLAAGKSCEMNVKFKPTAVGTRTGELSVASNAAGAPHVVKLGGIGVIRAGREEEDCDDENKCSQTTLPFTRRKKD